MRFAVTCLILSIAAEGASQPSLAALPRAEKEALGQITEILYQHAGWCAGQKRPQDAVRFAELGVRIAGPDYRLTKMLDANSGKQATDDANASAQVAEKSAAVLATCRDKLVEFARRCDEADAGELFDRYRAVLEREFPGPELAAALGLVEFTPYLELARQRDFDRLSAGGERIDGRWCERKEVAALNRDRAFSGRTWDLQEAGSTVRAIGTYRFARMLLRHKVAGLASVAALLDAQATALTSTKPAEAAAARKLARAVEGEAGHVVAVITKSTVDVPLDETGSACRRRLLQLLALADEHDLSGPFLLYWQVLQKYFGTRVDYRDLKLEYFEPYGLWVRPGDRQRLESGHELIDWSWLPPEEIQFRNKAHSRWETRWHLIDEAYDVEGILSYRKLEQIRTHACRFRQYLVETFGAELDLSQPRGSLRIIVTETQGEFQRQLAEEMSRFGPSSTPKRESHFAPAALYLWSTGERNPSLVTLEPASGDGSTKRIEIPEMLPILQHELTHQILFEFSKGEAATGGITGDNHWVVEGMAEYMASFAYSQGVWGHAYELASLTSSTDDAGTERDPFTYCNRELNGLPAFADMIELTKVEFKPDHYPVSATLTQFLMEGQREKYRKPLLAMVKLVHQLRDKPGSFQSCFGKIDLRAEGELWLKYIGAFSRGESR